MGTALRIVIVNYRTAPLAIECLRALALQLSELPEARVLVVDNDSRDGSADALRRAIDGQGWEDRCKLLSLERNGGFGAGNNAAIAHDRASDRPGDLYLLLNPDAVPQPGCVKELADFMDAHARVGIAGSAIEDGDGALQVTSHSMVSPLGELSDAAHLGPVERWLGRAPRSRGAPHRCDWVSGASMMVRASLIEQVGEFDEGYFLYFEEVDLCRRAATAGWEIWYVPTARVVHHMGSSTGLGDSRRRRPDYWFASRRRYFVKWYGRTGLATADLSWSLGRVLRAARGICPRTIAPPPDPPRFARDLLLGDARALWSQKR